MLMHRLNDVVKNFILDTFLCSPFRLLLYVPERFDTRSNKNYPIVTSYLENQVCSNIDRSSGLD